MGLHEQGESTQELFSTDVGLLELRTAGTGSAQARRHYTLRPTKQVCMLQIHRFAFSLAYAMQQLLSREFRYGSHIHSAPVYCTSINGHSVSTPSLAEQSEREVKLFLASVVQLVAICEIEALLARFIDEMTDSNKAACI